MTPMQLTNLPRHIPLSLYDETREAVRAAYSNLDGVVAVVESGRVLLPGISDMDFIVVVEPNTEIIIPPMKTYTADQQYAMSHKHFVISTTMYDKVSYIDPWMRGVTSLVGDAQRWKLPPHDFDANGFTALSWHFLFVNGIQDFIQNVGLVETTDVLSCRSFLEKIKYFNYYYRELIAAGIVTKEEQDANIDIFAELREQWFEYTDAQRIERVSATFVAFKESVQKLIDIFVQKVVLDIPEREIDASFTPHTKRQKQLLKQYPGSMILDLGKNVFVFDPTCTQVSVQTQICRALPPYLHASPYTESVVVLPMAFSALQNTLLFTDGPISNHYKASMVTQRSSVPCVHESALETRANMVNQTTNETSCIANVKPLFETYGYEHHTQRRSLRSLAFQCHEFCKKKLLHSCFRSVMIKKEATTCL